VVRVSSLDEKQIRRLQMRRRLTWATLVSIAIVVAALSHVRKVHATPDAHHHCNVASLKGTYGFRRTGVNNVGPIAEIGLDVFNGDGTRQIIRSTRSGNGEIQQWHEGPSGTYIVHWDCTGALFDADGTTRSHNLVVLDGGKRFILLSVRPGTIITAEGERLEEGQE